MIPRTIHRIWIGGPQPDWLDGFDRTWHHHHPHWNHVMWDDNTVRSLFPLDNQDLYDRAGELTEQGHVPQFRADVLRYEILWRYGGLYVDADFCCYRPVDPLLENCDAVSAFEVDGKWAVNGFLGATKGHRFVRRLIDGLPDSARAKAGQAPTRISGPQYLTGIWRQHPDELTVLPRKHFFPYQPSAVDVKRFPVDHDFTGDPDVYAVHVWRNKRRKMGLLEGLE